MGKDFKAAKPEFLDFSYKLPVELAISMQGEAQAGIDTSYAKMGEIESTIKSLPHLTADEEALNNRIGYYTNATDELTDAIAQNPVNWRRYQRDLTRLQSEIVQDEALKGIQSKYAESKAYLDKIEAARTSGKSPSYIADLTADYNRWMEGYGGWDNAENLSFINPVEYDLESELSKFAETIQANSNNSTTTLKNLWTEITQTGNVNEISKGRVLNALESFLTSNPDALTYLRQQQALGRDFSPANLIKSDSTINTNHPIAQMLDRISGAAAHRTATSTVSRGSSRGVNFANNSFNRLHESLLNNTYILTSGDGSTKTLENLAVQGKSVLDFVDTDGNMKTQVRIGNQAYSIVANPERVPKANVSTLESSISDALQRLYNDAISIVNYNPGLDLKDIMEQLAKSPDTRSKYFVNSTTRSHAFGGVVRQKLAMGSQNVSNLDEPPFPEWKRATQSSPFGQPPVAQPQNSTQSPQISFPIVNYTTTPIEDTNLGFPDVKAETIVKNYSDYFGEGRDIKQFSDADNFNINQENALNRFRTFITAAKEPYIIKKFITLQNMNVTNRNAEIRRNGSTNVTEYINSFDTEYDTSIDLIESKARGEQAYSDYISDNIEELGLNGFDINDLKTQFPTQFNAALQYIKSNPNIARPGEVQYGDDGNIKAMSPLLIKKFYERVNSDIQNIVNSYQQSIITENFNVEANDLAGSPQDIARVNPELKNLLILKPFLEAAYQRGYVNKLSKYEETARDITNTWDVSQSMIHDSRRSIDFNTSVGDGGGSNVENLKNTKQAFFESILNIPEAWEIVDPSLTGNLNTVKQKMFTASSDNILPGFKAVDTMTIRDMAQREASRNNTSFYTEIGSLVTPTKLVFDRNTSMGIMVNFKGKEYLVRPIENHTSDILNVFSGSEESPLRRDLSNMKNTYQLDAAQDLIDETNIIASNIHTINNLERVADNLWINSIGRSGKPHWVGNRPLDYTQNYLRANNTIGNVKIRLVPTAQGEIKVSYIPTGETDFIPLENNYGTIVGENIQTVFLNVKKTLEDKERIAAAQN